MGSLFLQRNVLATQMQYNRNEKPFSIAYLPCYNGQEEIERGSYAKRAHDISLDYFWIYRWAVFWFVCKCHNIQAAAQNIGYIAAIGVYAMQSPPWF